MRAIFGLLLLLFIPAAAAQHYPTKTHIRLVVGFPPGGATDLMARALNARLGEVLKQTVIVENKPGAGGTLATAEVAKSAPDGYTVNFAVNSHAINQALYPNLPFDTERDLRGVTLIGSLPQMLAAHPTATAATLPDFLRLAENARVYASAGVGSPGHFAAAYLESLSGVKFVHIPFKGAAAANTAAVGGHTPYVFSSFAGVMPHIRAGRLKAIAVTSPVRSSALPNVPTIAEAGFPGYDMDTWIAMFVPRATPDGIVKTLHAAVLEALKTPSVKEQIEGHSVRIIGAGPEELDRRVASDISTYTKIVRERAIKPE